MADDNVQSFSIDVSQYVDAVKKVIAINDQWATASSNVVQAIKGTGDAGRQVEASIKNIASATKLAVQGNKDLADSSGAVVKSIQQFNDLGELTKTTITQTLGAGKQLVSVFENIDGQLVLTGRTIKDTGNLFPIVTKQAQAFGVELLKISQNSGRALAKPIEIPKASIAFPDFDKDAIKIVDNLKLQVQKAFQNTPILNKEDFGRITAGLNALDFSKLTGNTAGIGTALNNLFSEIKSEGPKANAFIQQLGQSLIQLNNQTVGKSGVLVTDPTNALRNLIGPSKIAAGSDQEVLTANKALSQLLTQVNLLKEQGKSDNTIASLFAQLGQGSASVKELSAEFPGLTAAFVRFKNAVRDIGSEQGLSTLAQKQLQVAQQFKNDLIKQFDISQFANLKDVDVNRLQASINKATKTVATSPESLGLKDIEQITKQLADGTAAAFTGIRAKIAKDLTGIGTDYRTMVQNAELQTDKLIQKEEQLERAKNLASQFRSSLPIIPGGGTSQDATLTKTINDVANFATNAKLNLEQLNQVRLDILAHNFEALLDKPNKLVDLLFRAQVALERFNASATKANTATTPDILGKRANDISSLLSTTGIKIPDSGALALQARKQIEALAKASLDPKSLIDVAGLQNALRESLTLPPDVRSGAGLEGFRQQFDRIINTATQFQESERAAFEATQKDATKAAAVVEKELGAAFADVQKQIDATSASLAKVNQNLAAGVTAKNLEAKFPIQSQTATFNAVNRVTGDTITSSKDIEGSEASILRVQKAIEAVRVAEENAVIGAKELAAAQAKIDSGDKTGFKGPDAGKLNEAKSLIEKVEAAWNAYRETVRKGEAEFVSSESKKVAALEREEAALLAVQKEFDRRNQVALQNAQTGNVFSNVRNLAESSTTGFGAIPGSASVQNLEKINVAFGNITKLITSGTVTMKQFEAELDRVKSKSASGLIAPPTEANAALQDLHKNVVDVGAAFQSAQERGGRLNGALTSLNNIGKIFIAQQLHTAVSRLTIEFFNSVKAASDLSIEIGRIRAITQDAAAPTDAWAQSLRKVSDASGKSVTDVATAGYGALQNQITSTKDETEDFLRVATNFARTVGSEPKDAVGLLSGAINAYGLSTKDAEKLSAEFFSVIDLGNIEAKDLGNTYGRVAVLGRQLGVTHTELGAALATVSHSGLTAEDSMTRLNNLFSKFLHPTKEGKEFFAQFGAKTGTEFVKMAGGFVEAMKVIEASVKNGNLTLEEFTNELRGMQGQIALSGKAGETFRNFFDQISNSSGRFKNALELTKEPFGQEFTEQINKVKNLLTVDLATSLAKVFVNISKLFGDWADNIRRVATALVALGTATGGFIALRATITFLLTGFNELLPLIARTNTALLGLAVSAKSIIATGLFAGFAAVGFVAVDQFINYFKQKSKEAVEQAGRDAKAANDAAAATRAPRDTAVQASFDSSSKAFEQGFQTAINNVRLMLGRFIEQANNDLKIIGRELETVFGQVNTTIEKGLDKLKNSIHDAQIFNQNLPRSITDLQNEFLKNQFDIAKAVATEKDSKAGITGVGANTFDINAQRIIQLQREAAILKQQTFDRIDKTLNFSELTRSLDDAKAKLREVLAIENEMLRASEVAKVSVPSKTSNTLSTDQGGNTTAQQSEGSLISTVNREASLRRIVTIQQQLINLEVEFGAAAEKNALKQAKVEAEATLKFARLKELEKEINEFDPIKKFGGEAPPPIRNPAGEITKTTKEQLQDAVDALLAKQEEFKKISRELGQTPLQVAGLFPTFQAQLRAVDNLLEQFNAKQKDKLEGQLTLGNLNQEVKEVNAELTRMQDNLNGINKTIQELNGSFNKSTEEAASVAKAIGEATNNKPLGQPITIPGIATPAINSISKESLDAEKALQRFNEAFDKVKSDFGNLENLNNARAAVESLVNAVNKLNSASGSDRAFKELPIDNVNGQTVTLQNAVVKLQGLLAQASAAENRINQLDNQKTNIADNMENLKNSLTGLPAIIAGANPALQTFLTSSKVNVEVLNTTLDNTIAKLNDIIKLLQNANTNAPKVAVPPTSPTGTPTGTDPSTFAPSEGGGTSSFAKGGLVEGIGVVPNQTLSFIKSQSRNGDVVPALLRPREFVVTQEGTKKFLNELTMMNNGEDPFKKQVNRFFVNNYPTIGYDSPEINKEVNTNVTNITHNQNTNNEENNYRQQTQPIQVPTNSNIDTRTLKQLLKAIEYQTVMNQFPRTIKQNAAPMPVVISPDSDKPVQIINSFDDMSKTFSKIVGEKLREGLTIENFNLAVKTLDFIHGTKPRYYASGGFIDWEPRGTDKIPAMLTKGEYVMDAHHTRMFYPQLMSMSRGVRPEYFSSGGLVGGGGSVSNSNFGDINVSVSGNNESVGRRIGQEILREIRRGNVKLR